jgi:DNA-binding winged helix-turn-helix (wHTH) protein
VRLQFGEFSFDAETHQLSGSAGLLHLSPKAFRLLEVLLESRPRALSKDLLQETLWPDTFTEESSLAGLAAEIRRALDDDARDSRFVRTVFGYGYAFCGEVREPPASDVRAIAPCRLFWGKREIGLNEGENVLGRDAEAAVWIDSLAASRRHARIVVSGSEAVLEDLDSKNGTIVNGCLLEKPAILKDGDRIQIASATLIFRPFSTIGPTATAPEV